MLSEVNLGAIVVGTGISAPLGYRRIALQKLNQFSGCSLREARNLFGSAQNDEAVGIVSAKLKVLAILLSKIAGDLTLLSSGPQAGLNEINLPALQPGSCIVPGKVNPVAPLLMNQVAYLVSGYDLAISMAIERGSIGAECQRASNKLLYTRIAQNLIRAIEVFTRKCISGITANSETCEAYARRSAGLAATLVPLFGYEMAASVARAAIAKKKTVVEIVVERGLLDKERAEELLVQANFASLTDTGRD